MFVIDGSKTRKNRHAFPIYHFSLLLAIFAGGRRSLPSSLSFYTWYITLDVSNYVLPSFWKLISMRLVYSEDFFKK